MLLSAAPHRPPPLLSNTPFCNRRRTDNVFAHAGAFGRKALQRKAEDRRLDREPELALLAWLVGRRNDEVRRVAQQRRLDVATVCRREWMARMR